MSDPRIPQDDAFLGTWLLVPEKAQYELDQPPQSGLYHLSTDGEQYHFTVEWLDAAGQAHNTAFAGIPDGQQYAYADNPAVDAVAFTRVDAFTLDSDTFKDGQQIAHARRILADDGRTMTVSQGGTLPEGRTFTNVSVYVKQA